MPALKPRDTVRFFDAPLLENDLERRHQAELDLKRGASRFLAEGPNARRMTAADLPTVAPTPVPTAEVTDITSAALRRAADNAGMEIAQGLAPYGFKAKRGDPRISAPFAKAPHLMETEACRIPITLKDGSPGMMVVKMTNFEKGQAVVTPNGLAYKGVTPELMTKNERPAYRVLGFRADANGKLLSVDPTLTAEGMAWKAGNTREIVAKFAQSAVNAQKQKQAHTAKADNRPMPTPSGSMAAIRQNTARQPSAGMKF